MTLRIAVSHPSSNPNARWTAQALDDAGALAAVYTSLDVRRVPGLRALIGERLYGRRAWSVAPSRVRSTLLPDLVGRLAARASQASGHDLAYLLHDALVARRLRSPLDAVYAFEDGAARSFRAARRLGAATVLELPAGDYREVRARSEAMLRAGRGPGFFAEPDWKLRRKEDELRAADVLVAASHYSQGALVRERPGKDVILAPYPMPTDEFAPRLDPATGPLRLGFVGGLSCRKGVLDLLEVWRALRPAAPGATLTLVGGATADHERVAPLLDGVRWIGSASRRELGDLLRDMDALVLPSWCDGYGLVIGEALACGTPVIATRCTGAHGVVTHGQEGWLFDAGDVAALGGLLEEALVRPGVLRVMRAPARRLAEAWSPDRVLPGNAAAIMAAVQRALERRGANHA